ncbi:hypothetical protein EMIT0215P_30438 [Pseudomonas serboccidentalis]
MVNREQFKLSSPEGVLHTAATALHYTDIDVRGANDGTYAMNSSQVTKPEPLILQRQPTLPAPLPPPKADKASVLVGISHPSQGNRPRSDSRRSAGLTIR